MKAKTPPDRDPSAVLHQLELERIAAEQLVGLREIARTHLPALPHPLGVPEAAALMASFEAFVLLTIGDPEAAPVLLGVCGALRHITGNLLAAGNAVIKAAEQFKAEQAPAPTED